MSAITEEYNLPDYFGASMSRGGNKFKQNLNQIPSIKEMKSSHIKRMENHTSLWFQLNEFGAENLVLFEEFSRTALEVVTGNYFYKRWQELKEFLSEYDEDKTDLFSDNQTVTVTKVDVIKKQLEDLRIQMEVIRRELKHKENKCLIVNDGKAPTDSSKPVNRRASITPAELDEAKEQRARDRAKEQARLRESIANSNQCYDVNAND